MTSSTAELTVRLRRPHEKQRDFIDSQAPRIIIRAGRRSGKTVGIAIHAVRQFLAGKRVLYGTPTADQLDAFWFEVKRALAEPIEEGIYYKNESMHIIERAGTKQRIRGKTCWNADTLRGDSADLLILDEYQLMNEDAWELVGAPMLLDHNGDAVFIYTPPSLHSRSVTKARDPRHASKLFAAAQADTSGRWQATHFTSYDNPHISETALADLANDMTRLAYRQEILAEDVEEVPGALWTLSELDSHRVTEVPQLQRVVVAIDPAGTHKPGSDQTGITVAGWGDDGHYYVLHCRGYRLSPLGWASRAVDLYDQHQADLILGETNNGGEMVESTIYQVRQAAPFKMIHASRGKALRAEPVASLYEKGMVHHVGIHAEAEEQMCSFPVASEHDDMVDSLVFAITELVSGGGWLVFGGGEE